MQRPLRPLITIALWPLRPLRPLRPLMQRPLRPLKQHEDQHDYDNEGIMYFSVWFPSKSSGSGGFVDLIRFHVASAENLGAQKHGASLTVVTLAEDVLQQIGTKTLRDQAKHVLAELSRLQKLHRFLRILRMAQTDLTDLGVFVPAHKIHWVKQIEYMKMFFFQRAIAAGSKRLHERPEEPRREPFRRATAPKVVYVDGDVIFGVGVARKMDRIFTASQFDVAFTYRPRQQRHSSAGRTNSGVILVRPSQRVLDFWRILVSKCNATGAGNQVALDRMGVPYVAWGETYRFQLPAQYARNTSRYPPLENITILSLPFDAGDVQWAKPECSSFLIKNKTALKAHTSASPGAMQPVDLAIAHIKGSKNLGHCDCRTFAGMGTSIGRFGVHDPWKASGRC